MKLLTIILALLVCCGPVVGQATRPRSSRIITGSAWPYGTPEVGDEWIDTSVSPAETRNCLTAGTWSTVAVLSPDGSSSNTINGSGQTVQIALSGFRGVGVTITGTWSGTLVPELSMDGGSSWIAAQLYDSVARTFSTSTTANIASSIVLTGGASHVRIRSSSWTSGTATIALRSTEASTPVVDGSLNTQTSKITQAVATPLTTLFNAASANGFSSTMDVSGYTSISFVVTGTFDASVSFQGSVDGVNWVTLTVVAWDSGGFWNTTYDAPGSYVTWVGSLSQVRARIEDYSSGSVTVKAVASLAMSTIAFKGIEMIPTAPIKITGSAGNAVDASVTANTAPPNQIVTGGMYNSTKPSLTNGQSVAVQVDAKGNSLSVVRDAAGNDRGANVDSSNRLSVSVDNSPTVTATQSTATSLKTQAESYQGGSAVGSSNPLQVTLANTGPNATAVKVDGSASVQPISASSLPLPTSAATSTKQSDGSQKTQVVDGSGNVIGSTSNALDINIKSGNPSSIAVTQATASSLNADVNLKTVGGSSVSTAAGGVQKVGVVGNSGATVDASIGAATAPTNQVVTGGVFNSTKPTLTTGQSAAVQLDSKGNELSVVRDAAGNDRGANVNASNQLSVSVDNTPNVAVTSVPSNQSVNVAQVAGATVATGNGTASGTQRVSIASDNTPFAVKTDQTTHGTTDLVADDITKIGGTTVKNGGPSGSLGVGGPDANNASITGNPLLQGAEAQSGQPTAATTGNVRQLVASLDGALYTRQGGPVIWTCGVNNVAASLTQCQAAPGANLKLYITGIYVQTTTTTSGTYAIQTGTGSNCGTGTAALFPVSGTGNRFNAPITSNAMAAITFPVPLVAPANSAVCLIGVATNTISAQIVGFTAP